MRTTARCAILLSLLLSGADALGYSTLTGVSLSRSFSPSTPQPGQTVTVTLTVKTGSLGSPLRGFYVSDQVPDGLLPSSGSVTLGVSALTVKTESTASGAIYTGAQTLRWVLDQPPSWPENNPVPAATTLVVTYQVTVPGSATGNLSFPGASWVGMIPSLGDSGDHFGYEDGTSTLPVDTQPALALSPTSLSFSAQEGGSNPSSRSVAVSNPGSGTLATVTTSPTYGGSGQGWLTATTSGSGNSQSLENTVDLAGLAPNTYAATMQVSAVGASNSPQSYTVSFTVSAKPSTTDPTIVLAPTSLQFTANEGGAAPKTQSVAVINSGAGTMAVVSHTVSYVSGKDWLTVTPAGADNSQSLVNGVDPTGLAPDTYTATVAVDSAGASNTPQNYTVSFTVASKTGPTPDAGPGADLATPGDSGGNNLTGQETLEGGCSLGGRAAPGGLGLLLVLLALLTRRRR